MNSNSNSYNMLCSAQRRAYFWRQLVQMQLLNRQAIRVLDLALRLLPRGRLVQGEASVGNVTCCAGVVVLLVACHLAVAVLQLAKEGSVGIVDDVECLFVRHDVVA